MNLFISNYSSLHKGYYTLGWNNLAAQTNKSATPNLEDQAGKSDLITKKEDAIPLFSLPLENGRITWDYGPQINPWTKEEFFHEGLDIASSVGSPITSVGDGVVLETGYKPKSFGYYLYIEHSNGYISFYAHMKYKVGLEAGTHVKAGDQLGLLGNSGITKGPHLHFALTKNNESVDPKVYMPSMKYWKVISTD